MMNRHNILQSLDPLPGMVMDLHLVKCSVIDLVIQTDSNSQMVTAMDLLTVTLKQKDSD